ncbi:MAG: ATP-binding protein [Gammaproteobacteria bacterium]|nr:ATP-binding protein [Gammaproteobacteria bacterium]
MTTLEAMPDRAKRLGLWGLLAHWEELNVQDQSWLQRLLDWEEHERQRRSLERRLRQAHIGRFKPLADFDWHWLVKGDRVAVEELMTLEFIGEAANAVLLGPNGVGKSTIARNIAYQSVLQGHTVRFVSASEMLNELAAQDGDGALRRRLKLYAQPSLLVIDELGYLAYGNRHADLLFEIISRRYEHKSTVVTTNKPFAEWGELFPNATCVVSLIDRLVHKAEILNFEGESYRLKEARERREQKKKQRAARAGKSKTPSPKTSQ